MMDDGWKRHVGVEQPKELAPAQIVEVTVDGVPDIDRVDNHLWQKMSICRNLESSTIYYRPILDPHDLPYVSAEGLAAGTKYVAKDKDGAVLSFGAKPRYMESIGEWDFLPGDADHLTVNELYTGEPGPEFAIPGEPENSLARVWCEES